MPGWPAATAGAPASVGRGSHSVSRGPGTTTPWSPTMGRSSTRRVWVSGVVPTLVIWRA